jgi:hypothetical protein
MQGISEKTEENLECKPQVQHPMMTTSGHALILLKKRNDLKVRSRRRFCGEVMSKEEIFPLIVLCVIEQRNSGEMREDTTSNAG